MSARWVWLPAAVLDTAGRLHTVDGWVSDAAPGLIVTRSLVAADVPMGAPQDGWTVTHRASGCRVSSWPNRETAQAEAVRLAQMCDWTQDRDTLAGSRVLREAVGVGR